MTVLNDADDIKLGDEQVDAIYLGADQVWIGTPPSHFVGGVEWVEDGFRYHKFRLVENGNQLEFRPDSNNTPVDVEYCIVAGGGAGGGTFGNAATGSGGGGGGVLVGTASLDTTQLVVVGAGGIANTTDGDPAKLAKTGKNSSLGALIAYGGGPGRGGVSQYTTPPDGGCGGGGQGAYGGDKAPGAGVAGQGFAGGAATYLSGSSNNGGGGGAGGPGLPNGQSGANFSGGGGPGKEWPAGSGEFYGGGGGGGGDSNYSPPALGGIGGGGDGTYADSTPGGDGESGRGGGGGGGGKYAIGGQGGDGVVLVRYLENANFPPPTPAPPVQALGGVMFWEDGYTYHKFGQSDLLKVYQSPVPEPIEYIVVAGGGGGGGGSSSGPYYSGGGGGAGGALVGSMTPAEGTLDIVIGAGGTAGYQLGYKGGSSKIGAVEVNGGGAGSTRDGFQYGEVTSGGSSGGGYAQTNANGGAGAATPAGQGNVGASGQGGQSPYAWSGGGGGGGKGAVGVRADINTAGLGGDGVEFPVGSGRWYAGGGNGATAGQSAATPGASGGKGGGGRGGFYVSQARRTAAYGVNGKGGGGGGQSEQYGSGGQGGSGAVVVRYPTPNDPFPTPDMEAMDGTLRYWFDFSDNSTITLISGNEVNRVDDKSAAGIARGSYLRPYSNRPLIGTSLYGKQCIDFVSRQPFLMTNSWMPPASSYDKGTIFLVYECLVGGATGQIVTFSNPNNYYLISVNTSNNVQKRLTFTWSSSTIEIVTSSLVPDAYGYPAEGCDDLMTKVVSFRQKSLADGQARDLVDYSIGLKTTGVYATNQSGSDITAVGGNASAGAVFQGQLMEFLQWDEYLPDDQSKQIAEYLRRKWAVA